MRKPGRPTGSKIRDNIIDILFVMDEGYGYDIHKIYQSIFGKVAQKSIYYNLNRGIDTNEFKLKEVKKEVGDFSWGSVVEKNIYCLGDAAAPRINPDIKSYFDSKK